MAGDPIGLQDTIQATLWPSGQCYPVAPGQTLLAAGLQAGLPLPSSCRNGSCRACMGQLRSGRVRHRIDWPGLSPDERAEGFFLPCVAEPLGDDVVWRSMPWGREPESRGPQGG